MVFGLAGSSLLDVRYVREVHKNTYVPYSIGLLKKYVYFLDVLVPRTSLIRRRALCASRMPPRIVPNPNPGRARRAAGRAIVMSSDEESDEGAVDVRRVRRVHGEEEALDALEDDHEEQREELADDDDDDEENTTVQQPAFTTGLNTIIPKNKPELRRRYSTTHPVWTLVKKMGSKMQCVLCESIFSGGATRATEHILGPAHPIVQIDPLSPEGRALKRLKERVATRTEKKRKRDSIAEVNATAAQESPPHGNDAVSPLRRSPRVASTRNDRDSTSASLFISMKARAPPIVGGQRTIESSMLSVAEDKVDKSIGRFLYACNIPAAVVEHPEFISMLRNIKCAPTGYKGPSRHDILGHVLDEVVYDLRVEEQPLREAVASFGCTICSDGWETAEHDHLINMLVGTHKGMFFDGTIQLKSRDQEDAKTVAMLLSNLVKRTGPAAVVQVCTDTCAVMKAAWRLLCAEFPWITATCCGPHVLNLELKDIAKIPEIADIMAKVTQVLKVFWGRRKWPRKKLRELIAKTHGKEFGLYRAKKTRFAGRYKEMSRLLRCARHLNHISICARYGK